MSKVPYYYRESWGVGTNLQLHSLRQAWRLWGDLRQKQGFLKPSRITERCVVIIDLLGLSMSQLLGQNFSRSLEPRIPSLENLWKSFLGVVSLTEEKKESLKHRFQAFLVFYDDCRHFGTAKHDKIDTLTLEATVEYVELALDIWDAVCGHFRTTDNAALEFKSVRNILDESEEEESEDE
jgi:hypothetical protein